METEKQMQGAEHLKETLLKRSLLWLPQALQALRLSGGFQATP